MPIRYRPDEFELGVDVPLELFKEGLQICACRGKLS